MVLHVRRWGLLEEIGQCGCLAGGCTCLSLPGEVSSQFCHTLVPQAQEWWQVERSVAETPEAMSPHSHCSCEVTNSRFCVMEAQRIHTGKKEQVQRPHVRITVLDLPSRVFVCEDHRNGT